MSDGENPLGPLTIARAVFAGFAAIKVEGRVLRTVRQELEQALAQPVLDVYRAINKALGGLGLAAESKTEAVAPSAAAPAAPRATGADAEAAAARVIESALVGASLPPVVEIFVRQSWHQVLVRAHAAGGGTQGAQWQEVTGTLRDLVWSMRPQLDAGEQPRLLALLPVLLKKVTLGMDAVMLDPDGRKGVLDALMAHHHELLRQG
jgi:hypothetical protein